MADQTADDMPLVTETSGCQAQVLLEVMQIGAADISQFHVHDVGPDAFVWVEIGGVARQLLEPQAFCRTLSEEFFDGLSTWRLDKVEAQEHRGLPV